MFIVNIVLNTKNTLRLPVRRVATSRTWKRPQLRKYL